MGDVLRGYNETGTFPVDAGAAGALVGLVRAGTVSHRRPSASTPSWRATGEAPRAVAERLGPGAGERPGDALGRGSTKSLPRIRRSGALPGGETKLIGFFVGRS